MKALVSLPIWITVEDMDEAVDFARRLEDSAKSGALAELRNNHDIESLEDISHIVRMFPAQVLLLPEEREEEG